MTRFGLFVRLDESGGDGLVPISTLPADFYDHDEARHALVGRRWGRIYSLGDVVMARLVEAEPVTGGLVLELLEVLESGPGAGDTRPATAVRGKGSAGRTRPGQGKPGKAASGPARRSSKPSGKAGARRGGNPGGGRGRK